MKNKTFTLLIILANLSLRGFTQIVINYGPELGFSTSIKERSDDGWWGSSKSTALFSPVIGLAGQINITNHLQLTSGFQYEMIGSRKHTLISPSNEYREKITFHKLCIPLTMGFRFNKKKLHPSIFIGIKPNFFLYGKYYTESNYSPYPINIVEYNPLNPNQAEMPAKRFKNQYIFGLAGNIRQNLNITASVNIGKDIEFAQHKPQNPNDSFIGRISLQNIDCGISLIYLYKYRELGKNTNDK